MSKAFHLVYRTFVDAQIDGCGIRQQSRLEPTEGNGRTRLRSLLISAFGGTDANLFALVNEWRHLYHETRLELGGLGDV